MHSGLGVESCARLKREWVVRARAGNSVPTPGDADDFIAGHSYYALATIAHQANVPITARPSPTSASNGCSCPRRP